VTLQLHRQGSLAAVPLDPLEPGDLGDLAAAQLGDGELTEPLDWLDRRAVQSSGGSWD
jgi:hypothetical protein